MRIATLIKPIRDTSATDGWAIGSLDLYALSHAIELRDSASGSVVAIAMGAKAAAGVLNRALASGADEAIHLQVEDLESVDSRFVSTGLHSILATERFDLILCGQSSDDIETGTVGPQLAELLDLPHISTVTRIRPDGVHLFVDRDVVGGKQVLRVSIPALLVILSGREVALKYPTPRGMIAARKKPIRVAKRDSPGTPPGLSWTEPRLPGRANDGEILRDLAPAEAAKRIAEWLRERGLAG